MSRPRTAGGLGILALVVLMSGCLPRQHAPRTAEFFDRVRGWAGGGGGTYLQTTLIDVPAPDPYVDRDLWAAAGVGNPLGPEQTALLELNGLRVRVVSGVVPPRFLELVSSEQSTLDPMLRSASADKAKVVPVNGPIPDAAFRVRTDLRADDVKVDVTGAECGLAITATPTADGKVTLRCEPRVQHGDRQAWLRPTADGTGFARAEGKPLNAYPTFAFDVAIGPHDYLIVGPTEAPAETLGELFFRAAVGDRVRQRVLVVRAGTHADVADRPGSARTTAEAAALTPDLPPNRRR